MSRVIRSRTMPGTVAALLSLSAGFAPAQKKYPSRPIEFIVPWGPGGGADQVARKSAQLMEKDLKVSLPVINVPGATGRTGLAKLLTSAFFTAENGNLKTWADVEREAKK